MIQKSANACQHMNLEIREKNMFNFHFIKIHRWGFVIRSGIDGKSRTATYIKATCDNQSDTHLDAFLGAIQEYGIPLRTRSDKGGENILIARFMIDQRGVGKRSHICGRSVHNQRCIFYDLACNLLFALKSFNSWYFYFI